MNKLSINEFGKLRTLEKTIEKGQQTFLEVGSALLEIRDNNLWREKYDSFEQYCDKRWGWGKARASQIIAAAQVVKALPPEKFTMVNNERAARELKKVPVAARATTLDRIKDRGVPVTAKVIKEEAVAAQKNSHAEAVVDETGYPVPERAMPFWKRREEVSHLMSLAREIKSNIEAAWGDGKDPDLLFFGKGRLNQTFLTDLENIIRHLRSALPHAVCPYCAGKLSDNCAYCNKTGMIDRDRFNAAPEELLKMRAKSTKAKK